ncbi:MAG TPA: O-antigen ligase family protein, partial [Anaerolineales bacterium]|nr:O-antigen ligase family protein [Anaerolineales bacterium]
LSEELPALLTLGVGAAFYLVVATWPHTPGRLLTTLKLMNWSGMLLIGWCLVQTYFILFQESRYPSLVVQIQDWLSQRELFVGRVTGFAFEPSWLAHQLNVLFIPFWLAATVTRSSAHRRLAGISVENVLLALGFGMLFLSFSRIGILAALLMVSFLILPLAYRAGSRGLNRAVGGLDSLRRPLRAGLKLGLVIVVAAGYLAGLVAAVYAISRFDPRLGALFDNLQWDGNGIYSLANQLAFAERLVYWATGWFIFNDFPALGVGLGNAGFFFPEKMPPFGWALWEVDQIFFRLAHLPNPKSMWARILAETGWVGFSVFITWLYVLWRSARALSARTSPLLKTIALAGMLSLVAYLIEGFSLDSFAMPYLFVSMGLLTAGAAVRMDEEETA